MDDAELMTYLWPIVAEIVKTAVENRQNLIVEGCYIPFDWKAAFSQEYLQDIQYVCLVMSRQYIENQFERIVEKANVIERRQDDSSLTKEDLIAQNEYNLSQCIAHHCDYIIVDKLYEE